MNLKPYPEDSGFKGIHLWLFFSAQVPARDVILFARKLLALAGPPPPGLNREIFPKEPRVAAQALGSMLKLPLGVHKLTSRRCLFWDGSGQPVADQFALLRNLELISTNQFLAALEKVKSSLAGQPLDEPPADPTEVDKIFAGCNVLRHFRDKAEKTKWLNHVERLTLSGVLGHLGKAGHQAVHGVIRHTTNYNFRITQKWLDRVKGFPLSCPRIRERHSDVTPVVGCCCQFPQVRGGYPSPVLHADPELVVKIKARVAESEKREAQRAEGGGQRAEGVEQRAKGEEQRAEGGEQRAEGIEQRAQGGGQAEGGEQRAEGVEQRAEGGGNGAKSDMHEDKGKEREVRGVPSSSARGAPPSTFRTLPSALGPQPSALFQSYLALKKEQRAAQQKVVEIEQQLQALCEQQKTEQFVTDMGTFKRMKVGGEWRWVMEL